ncbi:type II toxin-antitoxin system ParD family antitoxin [Aetokthonos hydrillicola Thurmond2011]|jgi:antitoxin ParD1/3/4|uniref:Type II toxin-antitoxin system ParD family antitoxin n=1 Tax=Aetokthonos hydrillicola Thurmond2011 TaxID=2712845 RepID=A0AAP5MCU5_9CYAN|nr:type II toxin-antitoxin system ParD family antitoxin [Aetokthonos hydrillicola]MBO3462010.1 type II toxin-antitoxin system ParD family antitoxin [Aetokthonos hydrillicola CCALA 1050]MBW4584287.1 type II toxin-antitoxin system ParD family antitoxin [Aetokthonos hydrillicola CCALA 1050]MDR9898504.1 type II toxin-antitoxin system ParD family antitoxin [Aetokthonos hydrillicola Thurmond2011]
MNIQLKPEQEKLIQSQIESGKYNSPEEIVDVAFRLFEKLHSEYTDWVEETRQKVDLAVAELERGEGLDGETVVMEILDRFKKARQEKE